MYATNIKFNCKWDDCPWVEWVIRDSLKEGPWFPEEIVVLEFDLSRIWMRADGEEELYMIRLWNMTEEYIEYSLVEMLGDHGETIFSDTMFYKDYEKE